MNGEKQDFDHDKQNIRVVICDTDVTVNQVLMATAKLSK